MEGNMAIAQLIIAAAFIGVCTIGCVEETKLPQANSRDFALDRAEPPLSEAEARVADREQLRRVFFEQRGLSRR